MKQATILKNGVMTHRGQFESQQELDSWLAKHKAKGTFGVEDKWESQLVEISPAVYGEEGDLIQEAQFEEQQVQIAFQDYTVEIADITAQLEQQRINAEALAYLASTDWYVTRNAETGIAIPEEISQARAAARASIVR